ncbi:MAG: hypothetical protein KY459_13440 [Acidobacteria bacterium]|nr:hypothetical protein [Acidobacteriota bacterium]
MDILLVVALVVVLILDLAVLNQIIKSWHSGIRHDRHLQLLMILFVILLLAAMELVWSLFIVYAFTGG